MKAIFARRKTSTPDGRNFTPDFSQMVRIVRYNSVGFFFTDFVIPYVSGVMLGGSGLQVGLMYSFLTLGSSISGFLVGFLTDRMSKKTLVFIGASGRAASYMIIYSAIIVQSLFLLNIGTFVLGFLVAFFWVPYDTLVSQKSNKNHRSFAFGRRTGAQGQGILVGAVFGIAVFAIMTYLTPGNYALIYSPMLFYFVSNIVGGIIFLRNVDEKLTWKFLNRSRDLDDDISFSETHTAGSSKDLESDKSKQALPANRKAFLIGFIMLATAYLLSNMNGSIAKPFMQIYLNRDIEKNAVFILIAIAPANIIANLIGPRLGNIADHVNQYIGITVFSILAALITWAVINVNALWEFGLLEVADMSLATTISLLLSNIFSRISIANRGKVIGFSAAFQDLGGAVGPILGGLALDAFGVKMPFIISIFIVLALIPAYIISIRKLKPHLAEKFEPQTVE
ncbi:MAG TPA: MFS transporter [Candidatus Lokiarchaeia archaeon]|nr:MFS transporter [Candidatus Lokiarchaeia archaeon]